MVEIRGGGVRGVNPPPPQCARKCANLRNLKANVQILDKKTPQMVYPISPTGDRGYHSYSHHVTSGGSRGRRCPPPYFRPQTTMPSDLAPPIQTGAPYPNWRPSYTKILDPLLRDYPHLLKEEKKKERKEERKKERKKGRPPFQPPFL